MTTYTQSTGAAGTMRIDDDGNQTVDLYLLGVNELVDQVPFAYTLNGIRQNWMAFRLAPNVAWQKVISLYAATTQTVTFHLGATGNAKLGGPTDFSVDVQRAVSVGYGSGAARIVVGNVYKTAIPYVKDQGEWKQAETWGRLAGLWKPAT